MRPELTYNYYCQNGGALPPGQFEPWVKDAAALVYNLTATRMVVQSNQDAYLLAICAAIDSLAAYGDGDIPISSIHIGSFSASAGTAQTPGAGQSPNGLAELAAVRQLSRAVPSLLYGGVA